LQIFSSRQDLPDDGEKDWSGAGIAMAHLTLIVGGVRSGKSRFAEGLAGDLPQVTYLATAVAWPGDAEMEARILRHRQRRAQRPVPWRTVEEPWRVAEAVRTSGQAGCVLVECLTLWVTNLLTGLPGRPGLADEEILAAVTDLAVAAQHAQARVLVVSNEVGCGIVPDNPLGRRFTDLLGEANQQLAGAAEEVYGCLAGIGRRWKPV
jgi:adenosylcobinamide kinase/adenosylcobinamide-phosphate guanylyltransferase